ncbi:MAG: PCP reductase family protein, partial [Candidatus Stygibacter frigidus]|nr:PCP reductase family protein [Candidatus Stygibacter frigidus]
LYLKDNPKENFYFLFLDTESVNNENEFYKKLLSKLLTSEFVRTADKVFSVIKNTVPGIKKIGTDGVEFDNARDVNYFNEFVRVINLIVNEKKLVFLIDEFSQTVENIKKDEGASKAVHFLQTNREIRQTLSNKVQFIYSGSIGLEYIVKGLQAMSSINDIMPIKIKSLNNVEARKLITELSVNLNFTLSEDVIVYILEKVNWLIPFFIQLTIQAIKYFARENGISEITVTTIDEVLDELIDQRNYFDHWHTRLKNLLSTEEYNFAKELLNFVSVKSSIDSNEIYDLAAKHQLEDKYKDVVGSLKYDGYINNHEDVKIYQFNSPILKMWWWKYVAN